MKILEKALLENDSAAEEESRNLRTKRCARKRAWCEKTENCCCPMKCIYAWYNGQSSCDHTISTIWTSCPK
uniref:Delta-hexatoxin-Mg1b n=1 Tax=Macrothele gigas TaxID=223896 RepID=TXM14_MACGS|nr:RecName: Full=Delta-hexatoxin-Mg1b; Short=Delta-HXTX-Mg1b; AltName: Full=Delta-atracotoxin-9; AltName: Full=Neurotoxin magi-14; Flags: Precursor [Macrothele gigas]BAD13413.1 peptide toxin 9 precursor [Macrothele gigas]